MRLKESIAVVILAFVACKAEAPVEGTPEAAACPERPTYSEPGPLRILVLGDRTGRPDDALFRAALEEAARLKPDLVLCVGDLIEGYQPDEKLDEAQAEWNHVLGMIRRFLGDVPFYSTAGNHDVWSDKSEALFEEMLGQKINFAFDAGGARIIIFDSSRVKRETDLSDEALDWLVRELAHSSDHTARIVVTHLPLFAVSPGGRYGSPLHDVLIAGGADWVLTGHWHHAMSYDRDEIRYRMIGTTGARSHMPGHPESGNFQQFGFLTIDRGVVELSLVPMGSLLPDDAFPYELNQLEWKIENRAVTVEGFNIDALRPRRNGVFHAVVANVTDDPMNSEVSFKGSPSAWRVRPESRALSLSPGETKRLRFSFTRDPRESLFPGPRLSLSFPWPEDRKYLLDKEIRPQMMCRARAVAKAPVVDGELEDDPWKRATPIGPFNQTIGPEILGKTSTRVLVHDGSIYVGVRLEEPDMAHQSVGSATLDTPFEDEDHVLLFIDADPSDRIFTWVVVNAHGAAHSRRVGAAHGSQDEMTWTSGFNHAVARDENGWSVEIAMPLADLAVPSDAKRVLFNFVRGRVRTNVESRAYWQPLRDQDEPGFGVINIP